MKKAKQQIKFDKEGIVNTHSYFDKDEPFDSKKFQSNLQVQVKESSDDTVVFDIAGIDCSIANALRRIMIAEVPTMAFHKVLLYQNLSVIPDQVLVHRIGLMPIKVDAALFKFRKEDDSLDASNSLKFQLRVKCTKKPQFAKKSDQELETKYQPSEYLENAEVYASQFKWVPQGSQAEQFPQGIKLVHPNILVAKLRENQEIVLEVFAEKGIGRTHAKWSPVCTAYYRLQPLVNILPAFDQKKDGKELVKSCPVGVFDLQDGKAYVKDSRKCTVCRECLKYGGIELGKEKQHFIFTVESTGIYKATDLFLQALDIFQDKAKSYIF